jgi:cytochrome b
MAVGVQESPGPVRVWDVPTRLFHWLLVFLIAFSWWSGDARRMDWHRYSGYAVLGLLAFRIYWGFAGSSTARFAEFLRSPAAIWRYVRGLGPSGHGHNPLGAWSVLAMLLLLVTQVGLGLFSVDIDGIESGPLADRVSFDVGRAAADLHHTAFSALLGLIGLHLAAILFYAVVRRDNLLGPMITGTRRGPAGAPGMRPAPVWRVALGILIAGLAAWLIARGLRF